MKENNATFRKDLQNEGKEIAYLDVDRIVNEGLSGGSVHKRGDMANIEQTIHLPEEAPPNDNE
jgi:Fe-S cluster assembly ATPase SufC